MMYNVYTFPKMGCEPLALCIALANDAARCNNICVAGMHGLKCHWRSGCTVAHVAPCVPHASWTRRRAVRSQRMRHPRRPAHPQGLPAHAECPSVLTVLRLPRRALCRARLHLRCHAHTRDRLRLRRHTPARAPRRPRRRRRHLHRCCPACP